MVKLLIVASVFTLALLALRYASDRGLLAKDTRSGKAIAAATSDRAAEWYQVILGLATLLIAVVPPRRGDQAKHRSDYFPFKTYTSNDLDSLLLDLGVQYRDLPRLPLLEAPEEEALWDDATRSTRLFVFGRSGLGKTRFCVDLVNKLRQQSGEEWTVLVPDPDFDLPQPSAASAFKPRHLVLLIDDIHQLMAHDQHDHVDGSIAVRSLSDRLTAVIAYFERYSIDFRVLITARTDAQIEAQALRVLLAEFDELEAPPLYRSVTADFAKAVADYFGTSITPDAVDHIRKHSDATCAAIITAFATLSDASATTPPVLDLKAASLLDWRYPQNWQSSVYKTRIEPMPPRRAVFEALSILTKQGIVGSKELVVEVAARLLAGPFVWLNRRVVRNVLADDLQQNWLIVGSQRVSCPSALLSEVPLRSDWAIVLEQSVISLLRDSGTRETIELHVSSVVSALYAVDSKRGMRVLDVAISKAPHNAGLLVRRAVLSADLGRFEAALADTEAAMALEPTNANAAVVQSTVLTALHRSTEAVEAAQRATMIGPQLYYTWLVLGVVLSKKGDIAAAIDALERARQLNHRSAKVAYSLGIALERRPDPEAAMIAYQSAVTMAPGDARAWLTFGIFEDRQGDLSQARADLERAYALNPILAATALTLVLSKLGDFDAIAAIAADAVGSDPSAENYMRLLHALARTANRTTELSYATLAASMYPEDLDIQLLLGLALIRSEKTNDGVQVLSTAAAQASDAESLIRVGTAYRRAGTLLAASSESEQPGQVHWRTLFDSGSAAARRAISLAPREHAAHWLLGECLYRLEHYLEAESEFGLAASSPKVPARDDDSTKTALLESVNKSPSDISAWSALAAEAFRQRDVGLALDPAEAFLERASLEPEVFDAAIVDMLRLAPHRSMSFMRSVLDRYPTTALRLSNFAIAARFCGRLDEAETAMQEAVSLEERNPIYWYFRGVVSEERGHDPLAEHCYERALEIKFLPKAQRRLQNIRKRRLGVRPQAQVFD